MSASFSDEASTIFIPFLPYQLPKPKRKRSLPGNPDPEAEVLALSPRTLMTSNRFVCEVCNKGFQREQNLQLHRTGHNLPWKLKQKISKVDQMVRKKVYVCPEESCVHHHPSRALGDLTGIKKHFYRKHGEKNFKCEKCSKRYAVLSDWKAHVKTCGTREYKCSCGAIFSRRDSFMTHKGFCDALAEESSRIMASTSTAGFFSGNGSEPPTTLPMPWAPSADFISTDDAAPAPFKMNMTPPSLTYLQSSPLSTPAQPAMSATAVLQKAAICGPLVGRAASFHGLGTMWTRGSVAAANTTSQDQLDMGAKKMTTRDFLGVRTGEQLTAGGVPWLPTAFHSAMPTGGYSSHNSWFDNY